MTAWNILGGWATRVNHLVYVTLRARTQAIKDLAIANLLRFIQTENHALPAHRRLTVEILAHIRVYIPMTLGGGDSQWRNCVGDLALIPRGGNSSSSPAESHFAAYLRKIAKGLNEVNLFDVVCKVFVGVNGTGATDPPPLPTSVVVTTTPPPPPSPSCVVVHQQCHSARPLVVVHQCHSHLPLPRVCYFISATQTPLSLLCGSASVPLIPPPLLSHVVVHQCHPGPQGVHGSALGRGER